MNKKTVLLHYIQTQLDVNKKELDELKSAAKEAKNKVAEKELLVEALSEQLNEIQVHEMVENSSPMQNGDQILHIFSLQESGEGLMIKDITRALKAKYGENALSYGAVEKYIEKFLTLGKVEQTNVGAQRNRRFRIPQAALSSLDAQDLAAKESGAPIYLNDVRGVDVPYSNG